MSTGSERAWSTGRLDGRRKRSLLLFGRMYEDPRIEQEAFAPKGRVLCIASAGCVAGALAPTHEVLALDVNPVQLAYAARRLAGEPARRGLVERLLGLLRSLSPLAGWSRNQRNAFLALDDPKEQLAMWKEDFDTLRFRAALHLLLSRRMLRRAYADSLVDALPEDFSAVLRARLARGFSAHPNRTNPFVRALFAGELPPRREPDPRDRLEFARADVVSYLEAAPERSFDGYALSNVLDGAGEEYRARLFAALRRTARPGARVVLRSFLEPSGRTGDNRAAADRSLLWGVVEVRDALSKPPVGDTEGGG